MTDKQPDTTWNLLRSGQFASAAEKLREVIDAGSAPLDVLHNYAVSCYKTGRFSETFETCMRVLEDFPQSGRTRYLLGVVLKEAGEIDSAIDAFTELIEVSPELARAWYHRGTCHFARRRLKEAAADLSRAVVLDPLSLPARYNLGVVHVAAQCWDDAREDFAACLRLDPTGADEYAGLLVEIGRSEVCERVYSQGHRLKNMLGIVGDQLNALLRDVRSRLSEGERSRSDDVSAQQDLIYSDMAAFLNALQPKPLELDLVDVVDVLSRALFTASASTSLLTIEKQIEDTPEIVCDVESIHEAFLNIILNAAEAMPDGGTLIVHVGPGGADHVSVSFSDSGPGIDEDSRLKVFQFGYSTKVFGSGLGLSQAREALRMHGGRIDLESHRGDGSTFTVVLPHSPEIQLGVQDLTLRPALFEDPGELMMALPEDEGLLIL